MTLRAFRCAVILVALASGTRQAFPQGRGTIEATIPFTFMVGEKMFEPGDYIVDVAGTTGPSVLALRAKDGGERMMLDTEQLPEKDDPKAISLVFDEVGDRVYLMEIWGVLGSGRGVKHVVDGEVVKRASAERRQRITANRVAEPGDRKGGS